MLSNNRGRVWWAQLVHMQLQQQHPTPRAVPYGNGGGLGSVRYMTYTSCRTCNFDTTGGGTPGNTVRRRGGKVPIYLTWP